MTLNKTLIPFFLLNLIFNTALSQTVSTIDAGSWETDSIWSTGIPPNINSGNIDVVIKHAVTVSNSSFNATVRNLLIDNSEGNAATLSFNNGSSIRSLQINGDLTISAITNMDSRFQLQGSNTSCLVNGNILLTRNHDGSVNNFGLSIRNGSRLASLGNLDVLYQNSGDDGQEIFVRETSSLIIGGNVTLINSGGLEEISIDVVDNAVFQCQDLTGTLNGNESTEESRDLELRVLDNGQTTINGNLTLTRTGGRRINLSIGDGSSDNARLTVNGNVSINHLNGLDQSNRDLPISLTGSSSFIINGAFTAQSNSSRPLDITLRGTSVLDINGDVSLTGSTNSNLTITAAGNSSIFFGGNISLSFPNPANANVFSFSNTSPNISTITFDGSAPQFIPGGETYGNLIIDNSSDLSLGGNITVRNAFSIIQGKLLADGRTITMDVEGSTLSGSTNGYICDATLIRALPAGTGTHWFHIGSSTKGYSPLALSDLSEASTIRATYFPFSPATPTSPGPFDPDIHDTENLARISHGEYWYLTPTSGNVSAIVSLGWNSASDVNGTALDQLRIARWDGSQWQSTGNANLSGDQNSGLLTNMTASNEFGAFTLSSTTTANPLLPVVLLDFSAARHNGDIKIKWKTASEKNNRDFHLERSIDGKEFFLLHTMQGQGTIHTTTHYEWTDKQPLPCRTYYRLRQYDFDGKSETLGIKMIEPDDITNIRVLPNPVSLQNNIIIEAQICEDQDIIIDIYDNFGRLVSSRKSVQPNSSIPSQLLFSTEGTYMLRIFSQGKTTTRKIMVR